MRFQESFYLFAPVPTTSLRHVPILSNSSYIIMDFIEKKSQIKIKNSFL